MIDQTRRAILAAAAALAAIALAPGTSSAQEKFKAVTTFTVIADMAKNVAGDAAVVESITKPGAEIHNYQPTPRDILKAPPTANPQATANSTATGLLRPAPGSPKLGWRSTGPASDCASTLGDKDSTLTLHSKLFATLRYVVAGARAFSVRKRS